MAKGIIIRSMMLHLEGEWYGNDGRTFIKAIDDAFLQIGGSKDETRVLFPAAQGTFGTMILH
ncbi:MAG: hypothetical protein Ct9H300mP2_5090 [Candidatus Neomarinimicrobiota bacterium]|nr:MAG: hypothetical protein Ct9H300mP2_5090 [Candidatus Neomarinimicrobiota bacterium]